MLKDAAKELEAIYTSLGGEIFTSWTERMVELELTIVSEPAEDLADITARARALAAMREVEGGADETLYAGLCALLDDLVRLRETHPGL